ncbi:hypothetical protein [Halogeometricum borinquense]|uniref:hypothetical protein n=1 Tax=Halogeometricum borinquense TaxID=60847 RepID=UPI001F5E269C|nr:hypothetical protein [Halogeometricum borinquense]
MPRSYSEKVEHGFQQGIAFGYLYPRRRAVFAGVLSMTVGLFLAVAGLIQFGEIEGISQLGVLVTDPSVGAFAIVSVSITVGINVSTFLLFGLLAPDDLQSDVGVLRNPITHITSAAASALIFIIAFVAITFLNGLSQWLGIALAALVIAYRYNSSYFWSVLGGTRTQITWTSWTGILLPIVAAAIVYVTGSLPSWTIGEWGRRKLLRANRGTVVYRTGRYDSRTDQRAN